MPFKSSLKIVSCTFLMCQQHIPENYPLKECELSLGIMFSKKKTAYSTLQESYPLKECESSLRIMYSKNKYCLQHITRKLSAERMWIIPRSHVKLQKYCRLLIPRNISTEGKWITCDFMFNSKDSAENTITTQWNITNFRTFLPTYF